MKAEIVRQSITNFNTLELVTPSHPVQSPRVAQGLISPGRRLKQLRQARLRRAKFLEKDRAAHVRGTGNGKPRLNVNNRPRQVTKPKISQKREMFSSASSALVKKGSSMQTESYRDVSEMRSYLKSFDNFADEAPAVGLDPNSTLYKHAVADGKIQQIEETNGIFNLTSVTNGEEGEGEGLEGRGMSCNQSSTSLQELAMVVQHYNADETNNLYSTMYSKQGRSYKKVRELEERRRTKLKVPETEDMPPKTQELGRAPHLQQTAKLLAMEMDVLKFISIREDTLLEVKSVYSDLIQVVREERKQKCIIVDGKVVSGLGSASESTTTPGSVSTESAVEEEDSMTELDDEQKAEKRAQRRAAAEKRRRVKQRALALRRKLYELQEELGREVDRLRRATVPVVENINNWRAYVSAQEKKMLLTPSLPVFDFKGENYLLKMNRDMKFLDGDRLEDEEPERGPRNGLQLDLKQLENTTEQEPISEEALVALWIGFTTNGNPLLIPPSDLNVVESLIQRKERLDTEQRERKRRQVKNQIALGLKAGKSAKDIFAEMEGAEWNDNENTQNKPEVAPRLCNTHRMSAGADGRLSEGASKKHHNHHHHHHHNNSHRHHHSNHRHHHNNHHHHSHLTEYSTSTGPRSARAYDEPEFAFKNHGGQHHHHKKHHHHHHDHHYKIGERKHHNHHSKQHPLVSPHNHQQQEKPPPREPENVEDTAEFKSREFDLSIMPRTMPMIGTDAASESEFRSVSDVIVSEKAKLALLEEEQFIESRRRHEAYDPFANLEARGGMNSVLNQAIPSTEVLSKSKEILRRRQEEGNPTLSEDDPVSGFAGQPFNTIKQELPKHFFRPDLFCDQLKQALERSKQDRSRLNKSKDVRGAMVRSKLVQEDGANLRRAAQQHKKQQLLKRIQSLRKRKHRLGNLSKEDKAELLSCEMQFEVLRCGVDPVLDLDDREQENMFQFGGNEEDEELLHKEGEAATVLQSLLRMRKERKDFLAKMSELEKSRDEAEAHLVHTVEESAALCMQAQIRGHLGRKQAQLKEASSLMALAKQREYEEKKRTARMKAIQTIELQERGKKRREEIERESRNETKKGAREASKKAEAAKALSRQAISAALTNTVSRNVQIVQQNNTKAAIRIQAQIRQNQARTELSRKMKETNKDRAAIKIQSAARGMVVRNLYDELKAQEKERIRDEYARKRARERYAKLYSNATNATRAAIVAKDVKRIKNALHGFLPLIAKKSKLSLEVRETEQAQEKEKQIENEIRAKFPDVFKKC